MENDKKVGTFGIAFRTSPGRPGHHGVFAPSRAALGVNEERELVRTASPGRTAVPVRQRRQSSVHRHATSRLKHAKNGARGRSVKKLLARQT